jgi:hypothetical protein
MAQAGPNNQFGGRQGGLASLSYQSPGGKRRASGRSEEAGADEAHKYKHLGDVHHATLSS